MLRGRGAWRRGAWKRPVRTNRGRAAARRDRAGRKGSRGAGPAPCLPRPGGARRGDTRGRSSFPGGGGWRCRDSARRPALRGAWSRGPAWPSGGTGGRWCRACRRRAGARPRAGARGRAGCGRRARRWRRALSGGRGWGGPRGGVRGREARRGAGQRRTQLHASSRPRPRRRGGGRGRGRPIRRRRAVPRPVLGSNGGYGRGGGRRRWWTWALSRDERGAYRNISLLQPSRLYA